MSAPRWRWATSDRDDGERRVWSSKPSRYVLRNVGGRVLWDYYRNAGNRGRRASRAVSAAYFRKHPSIGRDLRPGEIRRLK